MPETTGLEIDPRIYLIIAFFIVVMMVIAGGISFKLSNINDETQRKKWWAEWFHGCSTEMAGALVTSVFIAFVLQMIQLNQQAEIEDRNRLVALARSSNNAEVINAIEELRSREWLELVEDIFVGESFEGADLRNVNLSNVQLNGIVLGGAKLQGARFVGANLSNAQLDIVDLTNVDFMDAVLVNVDFSTARNVDMAEYQGANLTNADFQNTLLRDVDFSNTTLNNTNFSGANLTCAIFDDTNFDDAIFDRNTVLPNGQFYTLGIDLTEAANIDDSNFCD